MGDDLKIGIMQPYFMPYIGYWQLMNAVDKYVIYDDVNYIKGGWINRNRILVNGKVTYYNVQLDGASPNKLINQISIDTNIGLLKKKYRTLEMSYAKAKSYKTAIELMHDIIFYECDNIVDYILNSFNVVNDYLGIDTELILSSAINKDNTKRGQDKVIEICKILDATEYYNAYGGINLYNKKDFEINGIELSFVKTKEYEYKQCCSGFAKDLSIIDLLFCLEREELIQLLYCFEVI